MKNTVSTTLSVVPPYDFDMSIHSHRYKKYHCDVYDRSGSVYKKAFEVNDNLLVAEVRSASSGKLRIALAGNKIEKEYLIPVKEAVRKQFFSRCDLKQFYHGIRRDPVMRKITGKFHGLKPNWPGDLFECMVRCIISQQINVIVADKFEMEFVQKFGKKIVQDGGIFFMFPTAKQVSEIEIKDLRQVKFSERKAEYVVGLARNVVDGKTDLPRIEQLPASQFVEEITKIRGIGPWTAECCLMHLGHPDVLPKGDIGLHHAIRKFYGYGKKVTVKKLLKVSRQWSGWQTLATYYLWHALTQERMNGV